MNHYTVYSWRCTESSDFVFLDHLQDLFGIKIIKIIGKDACFTQPLSVDLAPQCLAPAGIGNSKMNAVRVYLVPVFGCYIMTQRILKVMCGDLWIGCSS